MFKFLVEELNRIALRKNRVDRTFICTEALNKDIWSKLKNNSNNGKHVIVRQLIETEKQTECKNLINYSTNLVKTEFDHKVSLNRMTKTHKGYTVRMHCTKRKSDCNSNWYVRINVTTCSVIVTCNNPCQHCISTEPSKLKFYL